MASSSLALIFVLSLWSTKSQRINVEKLIKDSCKSEIDYSNKLEDLIIFMMKQRKEVRGYRRPELQNFKQDYLDKTEEFLTFHQQQTNITKGQQEELEELRKDNQEMKNRLTILEKLWNTSKAELNKSEDLRISMMEKRNELTGYQQELEDLKQECQNKTEEFQTFRLQQTNITSGQQKELEKLRKDNQEMKDRLTLFETLWCTIRDECREADFAGFTVMLGAVNLPQQGSIIKPSRIISQYSSLFSNTGEFLCFKDGVYVFFLHLVINSRSNGAWIFKNDIPMTLTWQDGPSVSTVVSGTASLVVDLRVGDRISIRSYKNNLHVNETSVWSGHFILQKSNEFVALQSTLKRNKNSYFISGKEMITNVGKTNYSLESGEFVCTKTGSYKVDINTIGNVNSSFEGVILYVNGKTILGNLLSWHFPEDYVYSSSSNTAILNLTSGDKVTLSVYSRNYLNLNNYSTFSIYTLSPMFDVENGFSCNIDPIVEGIITCQSPNTILNSSGYFTCKEEGYYYFSISLVTVLTNNGIQIYRNEEAFTHVWIGAKWGPWSTASTSLVIHLEVGDYITFRQMRKYLDVDPTSRVVGYKIYP